MELVTHNGVTLHYLAEPIHQTVFPDVPLTTAGFFHIKTLEALGLTTTRSILEWMVRNNQTIRDSSAWISACERFVLKITDAGHVFIPQNEAEVEALCASASNHGYFIPSFRPWTSIFRQYERNSSISSTDRFYLVESEDSPTPVVDFWYYSHASLYFYIASSPEEEGWSRVRNYTYKMDPDTHNFFRHTPRDKGSTLYFGMELEISTKLSLQELQYIVAQVEPKQERFFIGKSDSSISGRYPNKIELVTVPATPKYLRQAWSLFFSKLERLSKDKGGIYNFFDTGSSTSNGIHIHVSKDSFEDQLHHKKFVSVFNMTDKKTTSLLQEVSQRHTPYISNNYCRPAQDLDPKTYTLPARLKNCSTYRNRGTTNRGSSTTEVRLFQGVVDINHIKKCIDFLHAMHEYTAQVPFSYLNWKFSSKFKEFVLKSCRFPNYRKEIK